MNLKNFFALAVLFVAAACVSASNTKGVHSFVPSVPDVPLPKDFEVDPTTGSFFDSAEGRIVDTYAAGVSEPKEVEEFYRDVMPQFGWKEVSKLNFEKDGEKLIIEPEKGEYLTIVKYQLRPIL